MILFLFISNYLNVQERPQKSALKERNWYRRLIERPNAQSITEKGQEHEQKIKLDHIVSC